MKKIYLTLALAFMALAVCAQPAAHIEKLPTWGEHATVDRSCPPLPGMQKRQIAPRRASILTEQPAGTLHDGLTRSSVSMTTNLGQTKDNVKFEGKVCKWVDGDDGYVYIYDPIVAFHTDAWMKGEWGGRGAQGDTIWLTGPQLMKEEDYYGYFTYSYYAQRLIYKSEAWSVNSRNKKTMFIWRNGQLIMPKTTNVGFGFVNESNEPFGLMDHSSIAVPMTDTPLSLSDELLAKKQEMVMRYCNNYVDTAWNCRRIQMIVDEPNKAIYLQNVCESCPEAWIKGDIEGEKVTFADGQYLGIYEEQQYYAYTRGLATETVWWEEGGQYYYNFNFGGPLTFTYDRAKGTLSSDGSGLAIIPGRESSYYINYYLHPQIVPITNEAKAPVAPVFDPSYCYQFGDWNSGSMAPYLSVQFSLPTFSDDGTYLDSSKMSYAIYLDTMRYVLQPDEYSTITESIAELPYAFTDDYYIYVMGMAHALYLFEDCDSLGIQSIYTDGDTRLTSPISYYQMSKASAFTSRYGTAYYDNSATTWGTTPTGKKESYDVAKFLGTAADKGQKVEGVRIRLGKANVKNLHVWAATSLDQIENGAWTPDNEGLAMETIDATTGDVEVTFATPVVVPDEGLYLGYSFDIDDPTGDNIKPIALLKTKTEGGFWCHTSRTYRHWRDLSYAGTIDMDAIKVDVPDNGATLGTVSADVALLGTDASLKVALVNAGNNGIRNIEYTYTVNGTTATEELNLGSKPVGSQLGDSAIVSITIPAATFASGGLYPLTLSITKVNGQANAMKAERSINVPVYAQLPHHRSVEEEYTGTWCGWCPRGLKALEMMNERHPDDFIALSYHNGDVMTISLDYPSSVGSFPMAWLDRIVNTDPYLGTSGKALGIEDDWKALLANVAPADVEVAATLSDDLSTVDVSASYTFAVTDTKSHYKAEYVLLHDSLHGTGSKWAQANYYSGYTNNDANLREFVNGPSRITGYYFNDVVIASCRQSAQGGAYRTLPTSVTESQPVEDSFTFKLSKVTNSDGNKLIQDVGKLRVVALLIDRKTGAIVNARQAQVAMPTGIEAPDAAELANGAPEAIYDLNGRRITSLRRGINIVRDANGSIRKVMGR